jgi:hypothetical protein
MVHTPDIYIQQESVSAYIPHSNNAKNEFSTNNKQTNKQSPHRIENKGSGKKYLSGDEEWEDREHQKQA